MPDILRVIVPWTAPVYRQWSGPHPMMTSLLGAYPEVAFTTALTAPTPESAERARQDEAALRRQLSEPALGLAAADVDAFVASRDRESQAMLTAPHDLVLHHSMPFTFGQRPWIMHIEELVTLFAPVLWHGQTAHVRVRELPIFRLVRHLLESPACLAVSAHLRHSHEWLGRLFESERIAAKSRYMPFGVEFPPAVQARIAEGIAKRDASEDSGRDARLTFLFTNSWTQDPKSLVVRGGLDVLLAFARLQQDHPNCRLILRSALPTEMLGPTFADFVRGIPNVDIIDRMVSTDEMADLFIAADAYLLPSVGLHTVSLLQAMYFGAVLIAADAPGVEEFVTHNETGLMVPGRLGRTAWYDDTGLLNQTFEPLFQGVDQAFISGLYGEMNRVVAEPDLRRRLRRRARDHVLKNHAMGPWQAGMERILGDARRSIRGQKSG
ncbi:MAG: glycosyltransferase [Alphaproteobacteria bacterium]|nr:glycosyltransferase [Alphaproteobacteria bacterium]